MDGPLVPLRQALAADIGRNAERPCTPRLALVSLLWSRGVQAVACHRLAHACHRRGLWPLAEIFRRVAEILYGVDIAVDARIGPGFVLRHPSDVVVGSGTRIGTDVTLYNGVTLGVRKAWTTAEDGVPELGDQVVVFTGAKVLGPITLGRRAMVGANVVLTESVPEGARVFSPRPVVTNPDQAPRP
jgi:serine O-acetyltransferase